LKPRITKPTVCDVPRRRRKGEISFALKTSHNLRLCRFSNSLINFVERDSRSVSPNSAFISDSAGNNHIDFGSQRQFQDTFHFSTIKTFHRTGVITFIGHC